jgi:hypothetical protein
MSAIMAYITISISIVQIYIWIWSNALYINSTLTEYSTYIITYLASETILS